MDLQDHRNIVWIVRRGTPRAAALAGLWVLLSRGDASSWIVGVPAIAAATAVSLCLLPASTWTVRWRGVARFVPYFVWHSLRGGFDVARRALHPQLPLSPILVEYTLRLPPGPARVFLACTNSLLPGTLSAELHDERLVVHALSGSRDAVRSAVHELEARVADLFAVALEPGRGDQPAQEIA